MTQAPAPSLPVATTLGAAIVLAGAIAVVNGFGRFAYALLLPPMRDSLAWDYALSGWLNTANSLGYGCGSLLGWWLLRRWRAASLFLAGLAGTVLTLAFCAATQSLAWMMVWRFASGVGSAWVFACGGALVAATYRDAPAKAASAIAIYYAGGGLGMGLSGLLLWPVLDGAWPWPLGWLLLAGAGLLLSLAPAVLAWRSLQAPSTPSTTGATPPAAPTPAPGAQAMADSGHAHQARWRFAPITVGYFLFGAGYIVYLTFVMAWMRELQWGVGASIGLWVLMGAAVMASGPIWKGWMTRWWPAHTFAAACVCTALGTALPLAFSGALGLLASVLLVGGSFFMAPSAVMAFTRATLPEADWAKAMSLYTLVFSIGQCVGPVAAGWLADHHGLGSAMAAGALTLLGAAALGLAQRR
jgi:predicted MFS family arabinose efflux permease